MSDKPSKPRKTLGLPARAAGDERPVNPRRKPVRGSAPTARRDAPAAAIETPPAKPAWAKKPQGPRGAAPAGKDGAPRRERSERDGAGSPRTDGAPKARPSGPAERRFERGSERGDKPRTDRPPRRAPESEDRGPWGKIGRSDAPARPARPAPKAVNVPSGPPPEGVRVSKLMAERGLCSRREADSYIERGWVFANGERVTELGTRVDPSAVITMDQQAQVQQQRQMTILLHKPVGYVSGQPEPGYTPAVTLIQPENQYQMIDTPPFHPACLKGLAPAGRLDIDSTGLLVLTQDGRVARQLVGEDSDVEKEYLVRVEGDIVENGLALLNHGLALDGRQLRPALVEWLNDDQLRFRLKEGRKRQIRRMCELVGLHVVGLKRVRIGKVRLGELPLGQWRYLRDDETF